MFLWLFQAHLICMPILAIAANFPSEKFDPQNEKFFNYAAISHIFWRGEREFN